MAKTATAPVTLKKGSKVIATTDLRDVPEGTAGKVIMVTGLTWIRFWVRFENDVALGSIPRAKLATPGEWARKDDVVEVAATTGATADAGPADTGADESAGVTTPSGTFVAQSWLDKAAAARARLAG